MSDAEIRTLIEEHFKVDDDAVVLDLIAFARALIARTRERATANEFRPCFITGCRYEK
jgi:hypothetical protein